jgi:hypothetical protein
LPSAPRPVFVHFAGNCCCGGWPPGTVASGGWPPGTGMTGVTFASVASVGSVAIALWFGFFGNWKFPIDRFGEWVWYEC